MSANSDNHITLADDFRGFDIRQFCLPKRYEDYVESVLIPDGMVKDRIERMALDLVTTLETDQARSLTLLCVLKGGFKFLSELADGLQSTIRARGSSMTMSVEFIRVKSYLNDRAVHEPIISGLDNPESLKGKDLLVVEDIIDTGSTMSSLLEYLKTLSPRSVRVASLLVKRTPLSCGYKPDFTGFEVPNHFVVGHAFDYNDHFRDMQHICIINEVGKEHFSQPFGIH